MIKKVFSLLSCLTLFYTICSAQYVWTQVADFPGIPRYAATGFSINGKGYVITGYNSSILTLDENWEYNTVTDTWTQKADFPGGNTWYCASFAIGNKGYVVTGGSNDNTLYEYDPASDTWATKAPFPGHTRNQAVGFTLAGKGYVGLGWGQVPPWGWCGFDDFYEYDPATDSWTQKQTFPAGPRSEAGWFTIDNKGYICTGSNNEIYEKDLWEYTPSYNSWTQKADVPTAPRDVAYGFSLAGNGYITMGRGKNPSFYPMHDQWKYDPIADTWDSVTAMPTFNIKPVQFTIDSAVYVSTGTNVNEQTWKYSRATLTSMNEDKSGTDNLTLFPNPGSGEFSLMCPGNFKPVKARVFNILGEKVNEFDIEVLSNLAMFNLIGNSKGVYSIEFISAVGATKIQKVILQ